MAKPTHIPRYYADDKDVFDLLCQSAVTSDKLSEFLRRRGVIVSPLLPKEQVARYFQVSPLSWPQLEDLLNLIEREEREEKFTTHRLPLDNVDVTRLVEVAELVRGSRAAKHGEVYHVNKVGEASVLISVNYSVPNFGRTRVLQSDNKSHTIRLDRTSEGIKFRYHDNERMKSISTEIEKHLLPVNAPPVQREQIVISGLDGGQRARFFVELARGIKGYELKDQRGVQMDQPNAPESEEPDSEDEQSGESENGPDANGFQGIVKRALLHGTNLLTTPEYQAYLQKGYTISRLIWKMEPSESAQPLVEFFAEFDDGAAGVGFRYGVLGKFERKEGVEVAKTRKPLTPMEREPLLALIEASAFGALETVRPPSFRPEIPLVQTEKADATSNENLE